MKFGVMCFVSLAHNPGWSPATLTIADNTLFIEISLLILIIWRQVWKVFVATEYSKSGMERQQNILFSSVSESSNSTMTLYWNTLNVCFPPSDLYKIKTLRRVLWRRWAAIIRTTLATSWCSYRALPSDLYKIKTLRRVLWRWLPGAVIGLQWLIMKI